MNLQGHATTALHHALHSHHTNALWKEVISITSSSDDEGKPSLDELAHVVKFFRMSTLNKRLNIKL
jgi:hypothetical protein